jgi:hypothetical protein
VCTVCTVFTVLTEFTEQAELTGRLDGGFGQEEPGIRITAKPRIDHEYLEAG